jgi:hypothetical protein
MVNIFSEIFKKIQLKLLKQSQFQYEDEELEMHFWD